MPKSRESGTKEGKPGLFRRMKGKVFKGKKSLGDEKELPMPERQGYDDLDCLRLLAAQQGEGFDGERMADLLRLDDHEELFGRKGSTSFLCDSESAPVLSLEATPDSKDWPKDFAAWSVSVRESSVSSFVTFVDLEREVDGVPISIIVKAEIGGLYAPDGWERFKIRVREAETAYMAGVEKAKAFDVVLNDCGSISYILLNRQG
jgi:hypothetical protein